jgi:hypothetical protein
LIVGTVVMVVLLLADVKYTKIHHRFIRETSYQE